MTTTTTVTDNEGREFTVKLNSYSEESAVWLQGIDSDDPFDYSGTFTLDAARQIRDDLSAVIADIEEAIKPKPLTRDALTDLPTGTSVYENKRRYVKTSVGTFVKIFDPAFDPYLPVGTLYTYGELNGLVYAEEVN